MMKFIRLAVLFWVIISFSFTKSSVATHIVGVEMNYVCLDPSIGLYRITLQFYRDCSIGTAEADSAVYVSIYDVNNNYLAGVDRWFMPELSRDTLENTTYQLCLFIPQSICVEHIVYQAQVFIPSQPGGHYIVWQKCCRNQGITNIVNPLGTGGSWFMHVPDNSLAVCNSSPLFNNYPPTAICLDENLNYDHSASDPDGDMLVYKLCWPMDGANPPNVTPVPSFPKPYANVAYVPPYTVTNPLGGNDSLKIDPVTGLLTGIPRTLGKYVVGICVEEWRNGNLLSVNLRDFQFHVVECDTFSIADFSYTVDPCDATNITFKNKSINWHYANWDFGDLSVLDDTSDQDEPMFVYPDTGTYSTMLIINRGLSCADTIQLDVVVPYNIISADFDFDTVCVNEPAQFIDLSSSVGNVGNIAKWSWSFGDGNASSAKSPTHTYLWEGNFYVELIITADSGCSDTIGKTVKIYGQPTVDAGNDVTISLGETTTLTAISNVSNLTWSPDLALSSTNTSTTQANPIISTTYNVRAVNSFGCARNDTIRVTVLIPAKLKVPNAFTPNGDFVNDVFFAYDILGLEGAGLEDFILRVYNRWGEIIFESKSITKGWDGRHFKSGKKMEIGVYTWILQYNSQIDNQTKMQFGNVSLLR